MTSQKIQLVKTNKTIYTCPHSIFIISWAVIVQSWSWFWWIYLWDQRWASHGSKATNCWNSSRNKLDDDVVSPLQWKCFTNVESVKIYLIWNFGGVKWKTWKMCISWPSRWIAPIPSLVCPCYSYLWMFAKCGTWKTSGSLVRISGDSKCRWLLKISKFLFSCHFRLPFFVDWSQISTWLSYAYDLGQSVSRLSSIRLCEGSDFRKGISRFQLSPSICTFIHMFLIEWIAYIV